MIRFSRLRRVPLLRFTLVRFGIVGLLGEALYFLLYGLFISLTGSTSSPWPWREESAFWSMPTHILASLFV